MPNEQELEKDASVLSEPSDLSESNASATEEVAVAADKGDADGQSVAVAVDEQPSSDADNDNAEESEIEGDGSPTIEIVDNPNQQWFVVSAQAGQEKRAADTLRERIKVSGYEEKFGTVLVPSEEVVELRAGKRRRSERRFYPGYVFVQMEWSSETWEVVAKTTRITGFVGGTISKPTPLPKSEIQAILERIDQGGEKVTPKTVFEPGELIRIIDGPFDEFSGTVEEVNYKKQQLVVAVTIFGRSTPVELDFSQVEKG